MSQANPAAQKPICTICYEDLKPVVEVLQSIPICGHVFHELCLQQWLDYCPAGKKPTCPVCKQSCSLHPPTRLYFQSTGDAAHLTTSTQNPSFEASAEEVRRLEMKLSSLTTTFENQQAHLKKLNDEVMAWKELAEREEARRKAMNNEKECIEQLLNLKMGELSRKSLECTKLQEKSLALAKELAALKLATDMNLGEEEIMKLASLGHGSNLENAVEVLKRSLALRNKSYKELMAQCNLIGRSETRTQQKLSKAKELIKKLKTQLQDLRKELEEKENGILRDLKTSKRLKAEDTNSNHFNQNDCFLSSDLYSVENQTSEPVGARTGLNKGRSSCDDFHLLDSCVNGLEDQNGLISSAHEDDNKVVDLETDTSFYKDDALGLPSESLKNPPHASEKEKSYMLRQHPSTFITAEASFIENTNIANRFSYSDISSKLDERSILETSVDRSMARTNSTWNKEVLLIDDITKQNNSLAGGNGAKAQEATACPGAKRSVTKWCKTLTIPSSLEKQAAKNNGDLIAIGGDGRGGRVKVLRALNRFTDDKRQTFWPEKHKLGSKGGQSQIEHFFGKM
ncbi:uncharacterized protein [Typha latifolia]|uniref:uncharacterized protein isoform X1 n=1 Tax=Typha latifolia TaxID=4733 RepID=UPI003C2FDE96